MRSNRALLWASITQVSGLLLAGYWFKDALNTDAVAYLRLAEYYAGGQFGLAVSGYWGPLLSWLLALALKAGLPALAAARLVMGCSAVLFFVAGVILLQTAGLSGRWVRTGAWVLALVSIPWSVANITPDLLLAALLALATAFLMAARLDHKLLFTTAAGLLWGLAFLTKAVALPLGLLFIVGWQVWRWRHERLAGRRALAGALIFLAALSLPAAPWITILTRHYGSFTISTSARIAHTIAGPADLERYHSFARHFHRPEAGRVTAWEDPSRMEYQPWSPLEKAGYALHQARLSSWNFVLAQIMLMTVFLDWPVVLGALLLAWRKPAWRVFLPALPVIPALLFVAGLTLMYLPGYLILPEQRFFYPAAPFLFIAGVWLVETLRTRWPLPEAWSGAALAGSFVLPALALLLFFLPARRDAGTMARELAEALRPLEVSGPLAGSASQPGGRVGLYTAFFLGQPWLGDERSPTPESILASGARWFLVNNGTALAQTLSRTPDFEDITPSGLANRHPVRVFRIIRH